MWPTAGAESLVVSFLLHSFRRLAQTAKQRGFCSASAGLPERERRERERERVLAFSRKRTPRLHACVITLSLPYIACLGQRTNALTSLHKTGFSLQRLAAILAKERFIVGFCCCCGGGGCYCCCWRRFCVCGCEREEPCGDFNMYCLVLILVAVRASVLFCPSNCTVCMSSL